MKARAWAHVLRMSPREIVERASMGARRHLDRWAWHLRTPVWHRADLARALDPSVPALRHTARLLRDGDADAAHRVLSGHFAWRPSRFLLAPHAREAVARLIRARFPAAAADARRRADRALQGRVDVLGYHDVCLATNGGGAIDWHRDPVHGRRAPLAHWSRVSYLDPAIGDHKIIWESNRHQHWLALGRAHCLTSDPRYRAGFIAQLESWMAANPPRTGINWASMLELGLRSLSWIWALHLFVDDSEHTEAAGHDEPAWTVDLLVGLHAQLRLVERHLSTYFSPNTHLLGEALALYVAGLALPELRASARWAAIGRDVLVSESGRQILSDGGHAELSTYYHRYALDFYLMALAMAQGTGDVAAAPAFEHAVHRLARYAHTLSDRHFHLPQLGDDDGGQLLPLCGVDALDVGPSLAVAATLLAQPDLADGRPYEEVVWLTGTTPPPTPAPDRRTSAWLPDSGYVVSRTWRGDHLVMDVGHLGYLNAGHAHADALSITLTVAGRPLLIDSGTGCYTVDPAVRDRFRATSAHNTVTVDGHSQSEPDGPFHWRSRATAALDVSQLTSRFDYLEAFHDGYGPDGHRRQVMARPGCWIVVDWIGGPRQRHAVAHWHLDPAWRVDQPDAARVCLRHASGSRIWMLTTGSAFEAHTGEQAGLGWHAPAYGVIRPTTTLSTAISALPPFPIVTVLLESDDAPVLETIGDPIETSRSRAPLSFRLAGAGFREIVMVACPPLGMADGHTIGIPARGRFLCARTSTAGPTELWVADSGRAHDMRPVAAGANGSNRTEPQRSAVAR